jgi:hypothetical protein
MKCIEKHRMKSKVFLIINNEISNSFWDSEPLETSNSKKQEAFPFF